MDILIEIILEVYMELMLLIVPEKNLSKKQKFFATLAAVVVMLGMFALVIWGLVLIMDYGSLWGILPIVVAAALSLAQIVAGIVLYRKNHD